MRDTGYIVLAALAFAAGSAAIQAQDMAGMPGMSGMSGRDTLQASSGRMIVPMMKDPMMPGLQGVRPAVSPFVPHAAGAAHDLPVATPSVEMAVHDGDTITLTASLVRRTIAGRTVTMYAFNGQAPGPFLRVPQGATFYVKFHNAIGRPATIHWHGVRLDNAFDGSPGMTQPPVAPGGSFVYAVHCPDAGIFWYHDHVREDIGQPMGLYGNVYVEPRGERSLSHDAFLMLSDLLFDGDSVVPFGDEAPNFALMGRFGNVLLVNGEPRWHLEVSAGQVARLVLTNASSARTYNVSFGAAPIKLIASDQGRFAREIRVPSVVLAPGERYVVEVGFDTPGTFAVVNAVQAIDHFLGEFSAAVDTMGSVIVRGPAAKLPAAFGVMHDDSTVAREVAALESRFDGAPDEEVVLTTVIHDLPIPVMQFMSVDTLFRPALEWTDGMADMNWVATGKEVRWVIRDTKTGAENMQIHWRFAKGSYVKLRIFNDPRSLHPMNHPIHVHGQRFLVIARDGERNPYLVWKDTAIIPVGSTVDLLVEMSNPGTWMLHCHIGEHVESGMMAALTVDAH